MRVALLIGMLVLATADGALAQSQCVPLAPSDTCKGRFPRASQRIAIGDVIYCDGVPVSTVQYDIYALLGGIKIYQCSLDVPCSNTSLPASVLARFCP